jgi:hypothetical protein
MWSVCVIMGPWKRNKTSFLMLLAMHVAVNNIKLFSVAVGVQQWVRFALFSSYEIFHTVVNNNKQ